MPSADTRPFVLQIQGPWSCAGATRKRPGGVCHFSLADHAVLKARIDEVVKAIHGQLIVESLGDILARRYEYEDRAFEVTRAEVQHVARIGTHSDQCTAFRRLFTMKLRMASQAGDHLRPFVFAVEAGGWAPADYLVHFTVADDLLLDPMFEAIMQSVDEETFFFELCNAFARTSLENLSKVYEYNGRKFTIDCDEVKACVSGSLDDTCDALCHLLVRKLAEASEGAP